MEVEKSIIRSLELPELSQIGVVVRDLDKAIFYYKNVLGIGPFVCPEIIYTEKYYYGKAVSSTWIMGFASLGSVELELIQPVTPPTIHHDFLEDKGEGLHHLGFDVNNLSERVKTCKKMGIKVIQSGGIPGEVGFAYLDTVGIGGVIFELIQRKKRRV